MVRFFLLKFSEISGVRRVKDGVQMVTKSLSKKFSKLNLGVNIKHIYRTESGPSGDRVTIELDDGTKEEFDHVVLAAEAYNALQMLRDPTPGL